MRNPATPEALLARWDEALRDPSLTALALQGRDQRMAQDVARQQPPWSAAGIPHSHRHPRARRRLGFARFHAGLRRNHPYLQAPAIRVEIVSPSNIEAQMHEKTAACLAAGAREVWVANEQGSIRITGPQGEEPASDFPVRMTLPAAALKR